MLQQILQELILSFTKTKKETSFYRQRSFNKAINAIIIEIKKFKNLQQLLHF